MHHLPRARGFVAALALLSVAAIVGLQRCLSLDSRGLRAFRTFRARASADTFMLREPDATKQELYLAEDHPGRPEDPRELMTPELKAQIARRPPGDCCSHVHLLWIGDLDKAPTDRFAYPEKGFNLTVHTDAGEILDGFQPFVTRAYRKALPSVVGHDFLKLALLYKFGGFAVDADTSPVVNASEIRMPEGCELLLGKEVHLQRRSPKPVYREVGASDYGYSRPFQVLNWAMLAAAPRDPHVKWLLQAAMMHFVGLRDMEKAFVQDVAGSGLLTDYVAYLHERGGRSFQRVFEHRGFVAVKGLCLADDLLGRDWVRRRRASPEGSRPDTARAAAVSSFKSPLAADSSIDSVTSTPRPVSPSACRPESPLPSVHLPQSVPHDEEEIESEADNKDPRAPSEVTVLPPLVFPDDRKRLKVQWDAPAMQQQLQQQLEETKSPRLGAAPSQRSLYQKKLSATEFHASTPALVTTVVAAAPDGDAVSEASPRMIRHKTYVAGARRNTVSADGVSHHALERLGVNTDILKKEKGMKKLGISDVDIERSEELRRYTGIATKKTERNKVELVFGFTGEQLQRDKAIKRLGTTEQEIFDDYCRRVSLLGVHERPMASF